MTHFMLGQNSLNGNDQYTQILLHFEDYVGSPNILDSNRNVTRVWSNAGSPRPYISSNTKVFGNTSLLFPTVQAPNWIFTSNMTGLVLGNSNFTVDFWYFRATTAPGHAICINGSGNTPSDTAFIVANNNGFIRILLSNGSAVIWDYTTSVQTPFGAWCHIALVRNGAVVSIYINGTNAGATNIGTASLSGGASFYTIGARNTTIDYEFTGYLDEFRHSSTARWTSNFTPPVQAYG